MVNIRKFLIGLGLIPNPVGHTADTKGELEVITSDSRIFYHDGVSAQPLLTDTNIATVTNKSMDGNNNTFTNLPGSAVTGTVAIANGGTGQTTQQTAIDALAGAVTSGSVLRGDGTHVTLSAIQAGDVPTLNQNTSGTAANITATSNSTLTTLSALSLPGSQVSGNISGNAANITATSNSTLTTLSVLSLPGSQVSGNISGNAANVTGTVAIANGGTGQTAKTAAFDALSPTTTTGDIIYNNGSNNVRLGIGTSGQILTVASGIPSWATGSGGGGGALLTVVTKTANYTLTTSDNVVLANPSGAFTLTLPTAVGNSGQVYYLKKIANDFSNIVTIATTSAQTIDGYSSVSLSTYNEEWTLLSDGSNWRVLSHKTPTAPATYTMTLGATTTAPTKGTNTVDKATWTRNGRFCYISWSYKQTGAGSAGSGTYLMPLPSGLTIDTTYLPVPGNTLDPYNSVGGFSTDDGGTYTVGFSYAYDSSNLYGRFTYGGAGGQPMWGSSLVALSNATVWITMTANVPISGWYE